MLVTGFWKCSFCWMIAAKINWFFFQQRFSSRLILSIMFPFYKWFNKFLSFITNDVLSPHSFEYTFFIVWPHQRSIFPYVTSMKPFNHQSPKNGTRIASHRITSTTDRCYERITYHKASKKETLKFFILLLGFKASETISF